MRTIRSLAGKLPLALLAFATQACHSESGMTRVIPAECAIESRTITAAQLPTEFDDSRTYYYRAADLRDPKEMTCTLQQAGFNVTRAWQPLDNPLCMDPLGPTFTVELEMGNPAIVDHGFLGGVGRLSCATRLIAFRAPVSHPCAEVFIAGLIVEVRDAATGEPAAFNARGEIRDLGYLEVLRLDLSGGQVPETALRLIGAWERPGVYSVVVRKDGYRDWSSEAVVDQGECNVRTVTLQAALERL